MLRIPRAYGRAVRSLFLPGVLKHFLWPVLLAVGVWVGVGVLCWEGLAHWLVGLLRRWPTLVPYLSRGSTGERGLAGTLHVALYLASVPLMIPTALVVLELLALPIILDKVACVEYAQLARRHGGSQWTSIARTLRTFAMAAVLVVVTLPLWLVPGFGPAFSWLLSAWLNHRSFSYDVLMSHADAGELRSLPVRHRGRLFLLALGAASLTLIPILNLLAVPFAGLAFTHYLLEELRLERSRSEEARAIADLPRL